jgi:hypothetical protein
MPYRFLLDQNFPAPIVDMHGLDASVDYVALSTFDSTLTRRETPDWLIYLRAHEAGFTGVVTRDASQLEDVEELVALVATGLSVVTWAQPIDDSITEWGQLVAYMPLVVRQIEQDPAARVFTLPRPRLDRKNARPPRALLGEIASQRGVSYGELRSKAREGMRRMLRTRKLERLETYLDADRFRDPPADPKPSRS